MAYWLFKSEPSTYSISHLARDKKEWWDGIRNYQARNFMMQDMRVGDLIIFYHSSCPIPAAVGTAQVCAAAKPDPSQFDQNSEYYDSRSEPSNPRWHCVQVEFLSQFDSMVTLNLMRQTPALSQMLILKRGNRLSITPLTVSEWETIIHLSQNTTKPFHA